jgi:hypothetical protein
MLQRRKCNRPTQLRWVAGLVTLADTSAVPVRRLAAWNRMHPVPWLSSIDGTGKQRQSAGTEP